MALNRLTSAEAAATDLSVKHRHVEIEGTRIFYREDGPKNAPVVLLPHGYPSSFQFRNFMPALADRWRLIAPDYPGFGYSDTPDPSRFAYTFIRSMDTPISWSSSRRR